MNAGEILKNIDGLTHDKLTYFVRSGYVKPEKVRRGTLYYNDFSKDDLEVIKRAWGYIRKYDTKTRTAFERAKREADEKSQLKLFSTR
jgi:hypothetical protein